MRQSGYPVYQFPDGFDQYLDFVTAMECKIIFGHQAGACHEEDALWKTAFPEQIFNQLGMISFHLADRGPAFIHYIFISEDLNGNFS